MDDTYLILAIIGDTVLKLALFIIILKVIVKREVKKEMEKYIRKEPCINYSVN